MPMTSLRKIAIDCIIIMRSYSDDLETKGPVRVSEVEAAQKEILTIARRMAETGEINLGGSGGEDYI